MSAEIIAFDRPGHFTAADRSLLRSLSSARISAGEWAEVDKLTPGLDGDCWMVTLPSHEFACFSIERHVDGLYRRTDGQGRIIRTTRTLGVLLKA